MALLALTPVPLAQPQIGAELRCRQLPGAWQRCHMQLDASGLRWTLQFGHHSVEFRHDGHGQVSIRRAPGRWRAVQARWLADASLCWDGICAQGAFPLD